jgi:threonylcarbamoyladenosine tRNA methylthiotransferase MtaB
MPVPERSLSSSSAPKVVTLGCRLNAFESEAMREMAMRGGMEGTVIVNTCAVTAQAERQARQTIRKLARDNPGARIIVTGCAAQINPETFAAMEEVDRVLGNAEKLDPKILGGAEPFAVGDIMAERSAPPPLIGGFEGRTRAFVQIQQGCDHRCTYCAVPFARGPGRATPPEQVIEQIRILAAGGYPEAVLTGVDISSYGWRGMTLGGLVEKILGEVAELKRLRLSTIDPAAVDDGLIKALGGDDRLMPHVHLSIQSMDATILKRMGRRHTPEDVFDLCRRIRAARPDAAFGADLITGFPTETDKMFERTLSAVDSLGLAYLHVFPFSPRPGTPAARMPSAPPGAAKERAVRLRKIGRAALNRFLHAKIGHEIEVLCEDGGLGHCRDYAPARLVDKARPGDLVRARAIAAEGGLLIVGGALA